MQDETLPPDDGWHTAEHIMAKRPALTTRGIRRWAEGGLLPYWKRGAGDTSVRLFKLADVDALIESTYRPATHGPLAVM